MTAPTAPPPGPRGTGAPAASGRLRRWLAPALLMAVGLAGCGTAAGAEDDPPPATGASSPAAASPGEPVRDGSFEFTVTDVDCSQDTLGRPPQTMRAQGVYCLVAVTISNVGDVPQAVDVTAQRAYGAQDQEYAGAGGLAAYLPADRVLPAELEPGAEATGVLVFDLPASTELHQLELHDAPFSRGALVDLG